MKQTLHVKVLLLTFLAIPGISSLAEEAYPNYAPEINPTEAQVTPIGKKLTFSALGGSVPYPTKTTQCPPWTKSGQPTFEFFISPTLSVVGEETGDTREISTAEPAKGTVKVRVKQSWQDKTPTTDYTDSYSDYSTEVDAVIFKVVDDDAGRHWYHFSNPQWPKPTTVEERWFTIENDPPPSGAYEWSASPNIATLTDMSTKGTWVVGNSTGVGDVDLNITWNETTLQTYPMKIRKGKKDTVDWYDTDWEETTLSRGWERSLEVAVLDNLGESIDDGVGVNEEFGAKSNVHGNWGLPHAVGGELNASAFGDTYSVTYIALNAFMNPLPAHPDDPDAGDVVYEVEQKYYMGSSDSGDGDNFETHTLVYRKGYADWK